MPVSIGLSRPPRPPKRNSPGLVWRLRYNFRPLSVWKPSLIAGLSMKLESLNERAASNLSSRHVSGRCLCGAVELEIDFPAFWAWHDHSATSRRAHGAAYATYIGCWRKHARVTKGRRSIARFEDAKTESTRSFCSRCGTPLLYKRKRSPHMVKSASRRESRRRSRTGGGPTAPRRAGRM